MELITIIMVTSLLIIVLPLWLILHYVTGWRSGRTLSQEDQRRLAELWQTAGRMEERIGHLETILDQEAPGWRGRQE